MFLHLTRCCLVLMFAVINAQLYNDMGAAYTDQASVYTDQDVDDVGTYDYGDDDYEDDDLAHIIFSTEKLNELYLCLCLGTSEECKIQYHQDGDSWSVSVIQKNGTFEADNDLCKYYLCSHEEVSQEVTCSQAARSAACQAGVVAQFFQRKSHVCCGLTCIGLFWYSLGEQISFIQNASDVESCNTSCVCSGNGGEETTKVVKVPSNDTQTAKYTIHQPVRNISTVKTWSPTTTSSSSKITKWVSTTTKSNHSEVNPLVKSPLSDSKGDSKTIFIIIVVSSVVAVTVIILIIIAVFIIKRNSRQRSLTLKTDKEKSLETGNAPTTEPHLRSAMMGKTAAIYKRIPSAGADHSAADTNKHSSNAPGFSNGTNNDEITNKELKNTPDVINEYTYPTFSEVKRGNTNSSRIVNNRTEARPSESAALIDDGSENENGKLSLGIRELSSPSKDISLRQPLLLRPEVRESVV